MSGFATPGAVPEGRGAARRVIRVAGKRGGGRAGGGCWVVGVGRGPAGGRGTTGSPGAAPVFAHPPGQGSRLKERWLKPVMTIEQLLERRVEHRPAGRCCAGCRHLGALVRVTDAAGARRWRRVCARAAGGLTEPGWPACGSYEAPGGRGEPKREGTPSSGRLTPG